MISLLLSWGRKVFFWYKIWAMLLIMLCHICLLAAAEKIASGEIFEEDESEGITDFGDVSDIDEDEAPQEEDCHEDDAGQPTQSDLQQDSIASLSVPPDPAYDFCNPPSPGSSSSSSSSSSSEFPDSQKRQQLIVWFT